MDKIIVDIWKERGRIIELGPETWLQGETWPAPYLRTLPAESWMRGYVTMAHKLGEVLTDPPLKNIHFLGYRYASDYFESLAFCYNDNRKRPVEYITEPGHVHLSTAYELAMFRDAVEREIRNTPPWNTYVTIAAKPQRWLQTFMDDHYGRHEHSWSFSLGWKQDTLGQLLVGSATRIIGSVWLGFIQEWDVAITPNYEIRGQTKA